MKFAVVSLNLSGGQAVKNFFDTRMFRTLPIKTKYFYDFTGIEKDTYEESLDGLAKYIDTIYEGHMGFIEYPVSFGFEYLEILNKDLKFINIKRNKQSWINQMIMLRDMIDSSTVYQFEKLFCNHYINTNKNSIADLTEEELGNIYDKHHEALASFFDGKKNYLEIDFDDELIFVKISSFLELDENSL